MATEPYTYIAHKDGYWAAISSAERAPKDIRKFLGDYASRGFSIITTHSAAEHGAVLGALKPWPAALESR